MCARTVNGSEQLSYWRPGTSIYPECSSMLNAAPVINSFLSYTWLSKCFFWCFFFYLLTTFLFYRLFDNVLMKMYSLCGRRGDKKTFKGTKISGVIESRGGSRAAATSKMEHFLIIVNGFQPLTIITKRSILDVVAALYPPLATKWILFIWRVFLLSQKMNWVSYFPFSFYITNRKKIKFLTTFWNLENKFAIAMFWSCWTIDKQPCCNPVFL